MKKNDDSGCLWQALIAFLLMYALQQLSLIDRRLTDLEKRSGADHATAEATIVEASSVP